MYFIYLCYFQAKYGNLGLFVPSIKWEIGVVKFAVWELFLKKL